MEFGERLRLIREGRGLTQTEVAAMCGISQYKMSYWETREYAPSGRLLLGLCKALSVSADHLIGLDDDHAGESVPIDLIGLLRSSQQVKANGYELSRKTREAIASTVEAFASLVGTRQEGGDLAGNHRVSSNASGTGKAGEAALAAFDPHSEALRVCARYRIEPTEEVVSWLEQQIRTAGRLVEAAGEAQQEAT